WLATRTTTGATPPSGCAGPTGPPRGSLLLPGVPSSSASPTPTSRPRLLPWRMPPLSASLPSRTCGAADSPPRLPERTGPDAYALPLDDPQESEDGTGPPVADQPPRRRVRGCVRSGLA